MQTKALKRGPRVTALDQTSAPGLAAEDQQASSHRIRLESVSKVFPGDVHAVREVSLDIAPGEFMVLVGPSGCGKSTLLRMIAGLESTSSGLIEIGGEAVTDVPPQKRDVAMVFQNYALYPHMTVRQNCAFALKRRGLDKAEIVRRVDAVAQTLGLDELLDRRPAALSGGQRQRVAMARTIVREPRAFLMDEPLSNLDAKLRVVTRAELARLHTRLGVTTVYVTHDQVEAMTLGDRVAVMQDGVLQQCDTPAALFAEPANVFVAGFIGAPPMNLAAGRLESGRLLMGEISLPKPTRISSELGDRDVIVGIRPGQLTLATGESGSGQPRIAVTPTAIEELGAERNVMFHVDAPAVDEGVGLDAADLPHSAGQVPRALFALRDQGEQHVEVGRAIQVDVNCEEIRLFDRASGKALVP